MNLNQSILSDITVYMKYAKYIPELNRRETWDEIVSRNEAMHIKKYPELVTLIRGIYRQYVYPKKVLPSMRSLQFAGKPIDINPTRMYNCCYGPVDDWRIFSEIMFLLLGGTGVGYSVQRHHVDKLPYINKPNPNRKRRYLIGDSIEGWADAVKVLMKSYFFGGSTVQFDFSDVRPKGSKLITAGGKAPGPQPLKECLLKIDGILSEIPNGDKLSTVQAHDIICHIADAVLAGGIRRAALISLFSADDIEMLTCKSGNWWELNPQRGRANNSAVLIRYRADKATFDHIWEKIKNSGAGEPGIFWSNNAEWGTNPCAEIALRPYQFCNLCEVNVSDVEDQADLNARVSAAATIGTLQAGYTDFHYLRPVWKKTTEKEALLGVSMTGIASNAIHHLDLAEAAKHAIETNKDVAGRIGINSAARVTTIKPAGTTSLVLGCSSGCHAWHSPYYIRRIRVGKDEAIYQYLAENLPDLVEDCVFRPQDTAIIGIPQKAPDGAICRVDESALEFLERIKKLQLEWVVSGHVTGDNKHNVSATITVKDGIDSDSGWDAVGEWLWKNKKYYTGLSVLPYDGGTYLQTPFEEIDADMYERMSEHVHSINLADIVEGDDNTNLTGELACAGNACEIV